MTTDKDILREKLNDHYATIFEEKLIDEIIENGILRKIESNELLIDIGDKMTHIPLILSGAVKIIREDEKGDEIALYFLEKGDTCAISFINCLHSCKKELLVGCFFTFSLVVTGKAKCRSGCINFSNFRLQDGFPLLFSPSLL